MSSLPPQAQQPDPSQPDQGDEANKVCVKIELDTQTGQFTVGIENEEQPGAPEDETAEDYGMKPAKDIDDALRTAKTLLESGGKADTPDQGQEAFVSGYQDQASPDMLSSRGM